MKDLSQLTYIEKNFYFGSWSWRLQYKISLCFGTLVHVVHNCIMPGRSKLIPHELENKDIRVADSHLMAPLGKKHAPYSLKTSQQVLLFKHPITPQ